MIGNFFNQIVQVYSSISKYMFGVDEQTILQELALKNYQALENELKNREAEEMTAGRRILFYSAVIHTFPVTADILILAMKNNNHILFEKLLNGHLQISTEKMKELFKVAYQAEDPYYLKTLLEHPSTPSDIKELAFKKLNSEYERLNLLHDILHPKNIEEDIMYPPHAMPIVYQNNGYAMRAQELQEDRLASYHLGYRR